jgi:fibronectin type 3 domain-containing protein
VAYGPHDVMNWDINDSLFSIVDTTPPDTIVDLNVQLVDEDLHLSWTEPYDFVGVSYYLVHRCTTASLAGDSLASATETCYTDTGIVGNVNCHYFYTVRAVDRAGNKSADSNQVGEFDRYLISEQ